MASAKVRRVLRDDVAALDEVVHPQHDEGEEAGQRRHGLGRDVGIGGLGPEAVGGVSDDHPSVGRGGGPRRRPGARHGHNSAVTSVRHRSGLTSNTAAVRSLRDADFGFAHAPRGLTIRHPGLFGRMPYQTGPRTPPADPARSRPATNAPFAESTFGPWGDDRGRGVPRAAARDAGSGKPCLRSPARVSEERSPSTGVTVRRAASPPSRCLGDARRGRPRRWSRRSSGRGCVRRATLRRP